ncbi:MAK10-like protein [Tanacetum coccineum]
MGDKNPIRPLGDYSKPSHEGYRNTIELLLGNNVVPLRSDTIRERTCLHLFQFFLRDQASNWLERLPAGSITTWEDLTIRFNAQFFQPGRTAKLSNDILIRTINQSAGGKLRDRNAKESWALLEDLALYDNKSWNDPRDFAKPVKAIALPQDVPCTSDRRLIELENQVQRLTDAHLAPTQPTQVNKITTSCEICSGPHDSQYCMEDPEQAFVEYASSRTDEAGVGTLPSHTVKNPKLSTSLVLSARSYLTIDPQRSSHPSTSINAIKAHSKEANISQTSLPQTRMGIETQQPEEPEPTLEDEFQDLHLNLPLVEVLAHALIYNSILDKCVKSLELRKNGSAIVQGEVPKKMEDPELFTLPCRFGDSKPFDTLDDLGSCVNIIPLYLFKKLNIGLLEEIDHIFRLAKGTKSYHVGIVKDVEVHIGKLKLLNDFYVIDMKKDPETPLLVGRGFLATANAVIDCRVVKIAVGEGITMSVFRVKGVELGEEEAPYWTTLGKRESYKPRPRSDGIGARTPYHARKDLLDCHLLGEWEIARDAQLNPFKDTLMFRRMGKPPKNGDGAWHARIRLIDPDGEEFTKTLLSIPTTRKLSERESPREIIDLDHFYDT